MKAQGHMVCFDSAGSVAVFGIEIEKASGLAGFLTFVTVDSGAPGGTGDALTVDQSVTPCTFGALSASARSPRGNIVVKN